MSNQMQLELDQQKVRDYVRTYFDALTSNQLALDREAMLEPAGQLVLTTEMRVHYSDELLYVEIVVKTPDGKGVSRLREWIS